MISITPLNKLDLQRRDLALPLRDVRRPLHYSWLPYGQVLLSHTVAPRGLSYYRRLARHAVAARMLQHGDASMLGATACVKTAARRRLLETR